MSTYPGSWYVEVHIEFADKWEPVIASFGSKGYAQGYFAALCSIYPHPRYRLMKSNGEIAQEQQAKARAEQGGSGSTIV